MSGEDPIFHKQASIVQDANEGTCATRHLDLDSPVSFLQKGLCKTPL